MSSKVSAAKATSVAGRRMPNGLPSPPSSPTQSRSCVSGSSLSAMPAAGDEPGASSKPAVSPGLARRLASLLKDPDLPSLANISEGYQQACEERDVQIRLCTRAEIRKAAMEKQLKESKAALEQHVSESEATLQAAEAKHAAAEKTLRDETAALKKKVQEKEAAVDDLTKGLQKSKKELTAAEKSLAEANERVSEHRKAEDAALDAKRALEADIDKMHKDSDALTTMQSYLLPTKKMDTADIALCLDNIFHKAYQAVYACFSQDLPDAVFAVNPENTAWHDFKSEFPAIPLPASNSPDAKTMRGAAVLQCLGSVAAYELFQPVYIGGSGDELGAMLAGAKDPQQADVVRRALLQLKASSEEAEDADDDDSDYVNDEEEEKHSIHQRIKAVVEEVLDIVGGLLSPNQARDFGASLREWAKTTAGDWEATIQPHEQRLVALALPEYRDIAASSSPPDHWSALVYPSSSSSSPPPSASSRPRSYSTTQRFTTARRNSMSCIPSGLASPLAPSPPPPKATSTATSASPAVDPADVAFCIWPVFMFADKTLVKRGLAVTKNQAARAIEEDQHAAAPRRAQRRILRAAQSPRQAHPLSFLDDTTAA